MQSVYSLFLPKYFEREKELKQQKNTRRFELFGPSMLLGGTVFFLSLAPEEG